MATTSNFGMTLVEQAQAQKEVTINQALMVIDAFIGNSVADKDLATPPGSPVAGVVYIVAASPTGAWAGKATQLAYFDQIWRFVVPQTGARVWVRDEAAHYRFDGSAWVIIASGGGGGGSGDVVGPASATDNALARFDATTGKLIQNSGVVLDDSNNLSGVGAVASGAHAITATSAAAFVAGVNGATNPAFQVDSSNASSATGVKVTSAATGSGVTIQGIDSSGNGTLNVSATGSGGLNLSTGSGANPLTLKTNNTTRFTLSNAAYTFSGLTPNSGTTPRFSYQGTADTNLTASVEAVNVIWNLNQTRQHATGNITLQREFRLQPPTHSAVGASTITNAATFSIDGAPIGGTNLSMTNSSCFYCPGTAVGSGVTNSYGLNVTANTGATNDYAFRFEGAAGELVNLRTDGKWQLLATNTAGGTTGAQTIDKPSGTVNFAAAATSLVVTNSLCTTASLVFAMVRTNDSTAIIKNVVPAAGSFTIRLNAAATAETSVGFFIIN